MTGLVDVELRDGSRLVGVSWSGVPQPVAGTRAALRPGGGWSGRFDDVVGLPGLVVELDGGAVEADGGEERPVRDGLDEVAGRDEAVRSDEQREITVNLSVFRGYPAAGTAVAGSRAVWRKRGFCLQIDRSAG